MTYRNSDQQQWCEENLMPQKLPNPKNRQQSARVERYKLASHKNSISGFESQAAQGNVVPLENQTSHQETALHPAIIKEAIGLNTKK